MVIVWCEPLGDSAILVGVSLGSSLATVPWERVLSRREFDGSGASCGCDMIWRNSGTIGGSPRRGCMSVVARMVFKEASWRAKTGGEQQWPSCSSWTASLAAMVLHNCQGYVVSSEVRQWPAGSCPHGSCWWLLSQKDSSCLKERHVV